MDLQRFEKAAWAFYELERQGTRSGGDVPVPRNFDEHFLTAAIAISKLYSYGVDKLKEFESQDLVHRSTITGSSLECALHTMEKYFVDGERYFNVDYYEQLARSCQSAKSLYECIGF
jgi:hypothetical protein